MKKVVEFKKREQKDEVKEKETYCSKVRAVLLLGETADQEMLKKVIEAVYARTVRKLKTEQSLDEAPPENEAPREKVEEKKAPVISKELLDDLHLEFRKVIALTDVLELATYADTELLEHSEGYSLVVIREILEMMMKDLEDAGEGTWKPK